MIVTSKPRVTDKEQLVNVKVWTRHEESWNGSQPLAVFAEVNIGHSPVINASLYLHVDVENDNGTIFSMLPVQMMDNGSGGEEDDHS